MDAEEWERRRQAHYETKERGWSTVREEIEKMTEDEIEVPSRSKMKVSKSKSTLPETPSRKHKKAVSEARRQAYEAKLAENEVKRAKSEERRQQKEIEAAARSGRRQGMTFKSKVRDTVEYTTDRAKSKLQKMKPTVAEIVDVELEAARKKGYDAHMKDKRARELIKAEKQGRRQAMTFKSKVVEDANKVAEKMEPVGKRVAKNVGKLMGEAKYTAKAATKPHVKMPRITDKTTTTKQKTTTIATKQKAETKTKPGPAVRKGTIGHREHTLGKHEGGLPVKSNKGQLVNNRPNAKLHRSAKPLPKNIPKTTTVNKQKSAHVNRQRSVNFAMKKRSRK